MRWLKKQFEPGPFCLPADGLAARMVGDGILEDGEADLLMAEIEELIARFDPDALAEDFLRYE